MVKLYKEQILFIIISLIIISILGYYALSTSTKVNYNKVKNRYQKSLDSINFVTKSLSDFSNSEYVYTKDLFNFKIVKKKKKIVVEKKEKEFIKVYKNVKWVDTVKPFDKERVEMILFMNGKAKLMIDKKAGTYSIGDKIPIGTLIQKQLDIDTGNYTGKTRNKGTFHGLIKFISGRATYVLSVGDDAFKLRPGVDPSILKQSHIPNTRSNSNKKKGRGSSTGRKRERQ